MNLLLKINQISLRIFIGVLSGFILGVVARLWMRWISTEPEFTWSGSIFIVSGFVIFATSQLIIGLLRKRFRGKLATFAIRVVGVIFSLPIFAAAGAIMLPTVVLASIAIWRPSLRKSVKSVLLILALIMPVKVCIDIVSNFGWSVATIGRSLLFVLIYSIVIFATRPTVSARS